MGNGRRSFWPDLFFIGVPAAGAAAVWFFNLPTWLGVIALVALVISVISFLGDLGVFTGGGHADD